jgi:hypothetical protein
MVLIDGQVVRRAIQIGADIGKTRSCSSAEFKYIDSPHKVDPVKGGGIFPTVGNKCFACQMDHMKKLRFPEIVKA